MSEFRELQREVNANAHAKGFYTHPEPEGTRIALMHSELSELLETYRDATDNMPSPKIGSYHGATYAGDDGTFRVGFTCAEEELADVVIRAMDFAEEQGLDLWGAIKAKHAYNTGRPHMHGGKKF